MTLYKAGQEIHTMNDTPKNHKELNILIGRNVRRLRAMRGESQEQLGALIGVTFQQVQKYERGINQIRIFDLILIADNYGVSLNHLLGREDSALPEIYEDKAVLRLMRECQHVPANIALPLHDLLKTLRGKD